MGKVADVLQIMVDTMTPENWVCGAYMKFADDECNEEIGGCEVWHLHRALEMVAPRSQRKNWMGPWEGVGLELETRKLIQSVINEQYPNSPWDQEANEEGYDQIPRFNDRATKGDLSVMQRINEKALMQAVEKDL